MMLESELEKDVCKKAKLLGWWVAKFTSPGLRGVPDRLFIKNGRHVFIELKKPGETPRKDQALVMDEMAKHGAEVYWTDNYDEAIEILRRRV